MLLIFTHINTHTVCLKSSDLKIWFEKNRNNHSEEFYKIVLLKVANPWTIRTKKYRFSKAANLQPATLLKIIFCIGIFEAF